MWAGMTFTLLLFLAFSFSNLKLGGVGSALDDDMGVYACQLSVKLASAGVIWREGTSINKKRMPLPDWTIGKSVQYFLDGFIRKGPIHLEWCHSWESGSGLQESKLSKV